MANLPRRTPSDDPSKPRFQAKVEKTPIGVDEHGKDTFITVPVDEPCDACGARVGSTCQECGAILCAECNKNPHIGPAHDPDGHLTEPVDTESLPKDILFVLVTDRKTFSGVLRIDSSQSPEVLAELGEKLRVAGFETASLATRRLLRNAVNQLQK